jgi:anti-sigma factor RsiW
MPDRIDPNLIRQYADGELPADLASAVVQQLRREDQAAEAARQQVLFERHLRACVHEALSQTSAPSALREQVQAMFMEADTAQADSLARIDEYGVAVKTPAQGASAWRQFFASPSRVNVLAVAAVVALIASAVLFGIFGRTIDDVPPRAATDVVADAAEYADEAHGQCAQSVERLQSKAMWLTPESAEGKLSELLDGLPVTVFDLSPLGYEFVGARRSGMPFDKVPSGHLIYRKLTPNGQIAGMVSVFVAPARGCCKRMIEKLKPREWQTASDEARCQHRVLYSTDRKLVYFLVCCDENDLDPAAQMIAQAAASK